ncbi:acetylcholine receptor subunit alpha-type acr-16-like isoform X2 [Sitodiplosis mosellana]|uniref:acetylcholine receptor subunit alpha-type acr-16-like isoform X2 n=1 Tax=Sitodiplosis mosellana TaxID=263140 RepID=UPI002443B0AD|nr:acetylcholine receptor subunit alpha-type acr-16-like isoform X2 [Sitodiplosis mosellana]
MKYYLFLIVFFVGIELGKGMEDTGDADRRVNKPIWNETYVDALKRDLLMSYDKFARPTQHHNTTKVALNLKIKHVDFDEATSDFTVFAWFIMSWNDEKLRWDQSLYGNLTKLSLAQHEIWQPDITLYNSITHNMDYYGTVNCYVEPDGNVTWVPPATFKTFCDSSLRYWPFDSHKCTLLFGSWIYNGNEIDVVPKKTDSHLEMFIENPEWEVTDVKVGRSVNFFACCPEPYVDIHYNITVNRRSSIYHTVILAPAFVVILLTLLTFWLPAQYSEKILLNCVTALIIVLFLLYFSQKLNVMASQTPLIVLFYSHTLYMVCFSTLISVIVINLTRLKYQRALPWIIKKYLDGKLGDILLLDHIIDSEFSFLQHFRLTNSAVHPSSVNIRSISIY